ncbi:MAG: hypothetical protein ACHQUC_03725 [Chlamydiales bacterium]
MKKFSLCSVLLSLLALLPFQGHAVIYGVVTASNDPNNNELIVYDANGKLIQTVSTGGKGGVPPNIIAGGIAKTDTLLAAINYGSQTVSLFKQQDGALKLIKNFQTLSKPVSLAFGQNHLYVLGTATIESHKMDGESVADQPDGSTLLYVGDGSAAQVGVLTKQLIISERSNTIELVELRDGIVTDKLSSIQLPPPPGNKTPVGLATRNDTAYVTIAHSDKVGLVKDGKLALVISSDTQHAPCWLALMGDWLYCCNTPSKSISKYKVGVDSLALVDLIAVKTQGEPTDIDAEEGLVAVLERSNGAAQITQFAADINGNLKLANSAATANTANGVAIIKLKL